MGGIASATQMFLSAVRDKMEGLSVASIIRRAAENAAYAKNEHALKAGLSEITYVIRDGRLYSESYKIYFDDLINPPPERRSADYPEMPAHIIENLKEAQRAITSGKVFQLMVLSPAEDFKAEGSAKGQGYWMRRVGDEIHVVCTDLSAKSDTMRQEAASAFGIDLRQCLAGNEIHGGGVFLTNRNDVPTRGEMAHWSRISGDELLAKQYEAAIYLGEGVTLSEYMTRLVEIEEKALYQRLKEKNIDPEKEPAKAAREAVLYEKEVVEKILKETFAKRQSAENTSTGKRSEESFPRSFSSHSKTEERQSPSFAEISLKQKGDFPLAPSEISGGKTAALPSSLPGSFQAPLSDKGELPSQRIIAKYTEEKQLQNGIPREHPASESAVRPQEKGKNEELYLAVHIDQGRYKQDALYRFLKDSEKDNRQPLFRSPENQKEATPQIWAPVIRDASFSQQQGAPLSEKIIQFPKKAVPQHQATRPPVSQQREEKASLVFDRKKAHLTLRNIQRDRSKSEKLLARKLSSQASPGPIRRLHQQILTTYQRSLKKLLRTLHKNSLSRTKKLLLQALRIRKNSLASPHIRSQKLRNERRKITTQRARQEKRKLLQGKLRSTKRKEVLFRREISRRKLTRNVGSQLARKQLNHKKGHIQLTRRKQLRQRVPLSWKKENRDLVLLRKYLLTLRVRLHAAKNVSKMPLPMRQNISLKIFQALQKALLHIRHIQRLHPVSHQTQLRYRTLLSLLQRLREQKSLTERELRKARLLLRDLLAENETVLMTTRRKNKRKRSALEAFGEGIENSEDQFKEIDPSLENRDNVAASPFMNASRRRQNPSKSLDLFQEEFTDAEDTQAR